MGVSRNLNRKRARGGKLQERHGALFEDCDDEDVVVQKDKCNSEASKGEQELNPSSSKSAPNKLNVALKSSRNGHILKQPSSKSSKKGHILKQPNSKSSKKGQDLKPKSSKNGQQLNSKSSMKTQELYSESNKICKQIKLKSSNNEQDLNSDKITQGHVLPGVKDNSAKALKRSIDVKDKKKKKIKKTRDQCGQVLDDRGNIQDTSYGGMDVSVLDHVDNSQNAACADVDEGLHTIIKHDRS